MLSIIIPAHNEEKFIGKTLKSIFEQPYRDFEVIVVCNGCKDNTAKVARKFNVRVLEFSFSNVSKARNIGAKYANGERLVFLDADTMVEKNTLEKIANSKRGLGTCLGKPDIKKFIARFFMSLKNFYKYFALIFGLNFGLSTGLIFCDKKIFEKVKFDERKKLSEISDFIKRAKKYEKFTLLKTYVVTSMRRFEKKGYWYMVYYWLFKRKRYRAIR